MYETKDNLVLSSRAFMKMCNLRFLKFSSVFNSGRGQVLLPSGFEFLPEELRYLYWDRYPLESLPPNFCPKNLVELHMPWSNLIQLWNRDKARFIALGNLKILNLKQCLELIRVPELSSVPNLEDLCLDGCSSLIEIPSSIGELKCLKELNLREHRGFRISRVPLYKLQWNKSITILINQLKNLASLQCSGCEGLTLPPLTEHEVEDRTITFLEFRNCINLDKEKVMEDVLETHLLKQEIVKLCIPGDEVPQRMRYKNQSGSSLSFTLDKPNLIGVSLCLVFYPKNHYGYPVRFTCEAQFIDKSGHNSKNFNFDFPYSWAVDELESKHVCLWNELFNMEDSFVEASFQFCLYKFSSTLQCVGPYTEALPPRQSLIRCLKIVRLCITGDKVPQRMRYKNQSGPSLSFTLDQPNLIGVSLCLVFYPKNHYGYDVRFFCDAQFIDKSGHNSKKSAFCFHGIRVDELESEHVYLWNELFHMEDCFIEALFQFCIYKEPFEPIADPDIEAIIKCGVHPIYVRDNGGCRDKKRNSNQEDEEDEPSPLRLKQDQKPDNRQRNFS
ncbi:hypothetical protein GH714_019121 [Hevea brasiliensis]|uniref:Uncharacterized protein n=1 Tax=Hevea brasiliensis TaxID=3981 RepID=A0A6A6N3C3_HEVBR|nr:hypothetical protein GH714_019121 [Hevea brasiliensis]